MDKLSRLQKTLHWTFRCFGFLLFVFSIPGMLDDATTWDKWMKDVDWSTMLRWSLASFGLAITILASWRELGQLFSKIKNRLSRNRQEIDLLKTHSTEFVPQRDMSGWEVLLYLQRETKFGHGKSQREIEKIIRQAIVDDRITMWAKRQGSEVYSKVPKELFTTHNSTHKIELEPEGCGGIIRCDGWIGGGEVWRIPMFCRKQVESTWPSIQSNNSQDKVT